MTTTPSVRRASPYLARTMRMATLGAVLATTSLPASALAEEVYLVRGLLNAYSAGIDDIANKLKSRRINAKAMSNGAWVRQASDIIRRNKKNEVSFPIVIVGFSIGGVEAVNFANTLSNADIPVELVVGIDPGAPVPSPLGKTVRTAKTYRIITGHKFRGGFGFNGKIENNDASDYQVNHTTITMHPEIQRRVLADIKKAVRAR